MVLDSRGVSAIGLGLPRLGRNTIFPRADHIHATSGDADTVGGITPAQFLRSDVADTMEASTAGVLLTLNQQGAGNILRAQDNGSDALVVEDGRSIVVTLGDDAGAKAITIKNSSGTTVATIDSKGNLHLLGKVLKL